LLTNAATMSAANSMFSEVSVMDFFLSGFTLLQRSPRVERREAI
jgi:hypothetical protein